MGFLKREKSIEDLELERERAKVQADTAGYKSQIAEREAVIKQLKREYGSGWQKLLGVSSLTDVSTLRSFLSGAKKGMSKSAAVDPSMRKRMWGQ